MQLFKSKVLEVSQDKYKQFNKVKIEHDKETLWVWDFSDSKVGDTVLVGYDNHHNFFRTAKIK